MSHLPGRVAAVHCLDVLPLRDRDRQPALGQELPAQRRQAHQGQLALAEAGLVGLPQPGLGQPPERGQVGAGAGPQPLVQVDRLDQVRAHRPAAEAQRGQELVLDPARRQAAAALGAGLRARQERRQRLRHPVCAPRQSVQQVSKLSVVHGKVPSFAQSSIAICTKQQRHLHEGAGPFARLRPHPPPPASSASRPPRPGRGLCSTPGGQASGVRSQVLTAPGTSPHSPLRHLTSRIAQARTPAKRPLAQDVRRQVTRTSGLCHLSPDPVPDP